MHTCISDQREGGGGFPRSVRPVAKKFFSPRATHDDEEFDLRVSKVMEMELERGRAYVGCTFWRIFWGKDGRRRVV